MKAANLWLGIAVLRGLESQRPPGERLIHDPVSLQLLPRRWRLLLWLLAAIRAEQTILERREREFPGAMGNLLCRTRYVDDTVRAALERGAEQVVILGAGFDTRAYRIPGIDRARVFEVDHPVVQRAKRKALLRALGGVPRHVSMASVDLEHDDLSLALAGAGFRIAAPTVFVMEGVSQYVTRRALERALEFVADVGQPGSRLVFSYIRQAVINGDEATEVDRAIMERARKGGAPWRTGLDPAGIPDLLHRHGLGAVEELGGEDYLDRFLRPAGRDLETLECERVVVAEVV